VDDGLAAASNFPPRFRDSVKVPVFDLRLLARVGVTARATAPSESTAGLAGPLVYNDLPGTTGTAPGDVLAANRMDIRTVARAVNRYNAVFGTPEQDQTGAIAGDIAGATTRWFSISQASAFDPDAFRTYVESTPGEAQTLARIQQLEGLLAQLRGLGLTGAEYRVSAGRLLAPVTPAGQATPDQMARAIGRGS